MERIAREILAVARLLIAQFRTLNDFEVFEKGLAPGRTEIWYQNDRFARDGMMGMNWLRKQGLVPDPKVLKKTHVLLGSIKEANLNKIFAMMQGERWSPGGEARDFIRKSGAHHTSMSVGDVIKIGNKAWIVDSFGFEPLD